MKSFGGLNEKVKKILGLENFPCVTAIFFTFFLVKKRGKKVEKMCVTAAL